MLDPSCTTKMNPPPPGTIACGRSNYRTCDHVSGDTKISTPFGNFSVCQSFNRSSSCPTYCIRCTRYQVIYIGETCRQLNIRFGQYLRNVENKSHEKEQKAKHSDTNASRHINSEGHPTGDMVAQGLFSLHNDLTNASHLHHSFLIYYLLLGFPFRISISIFHVAFLHRILFSILVNHYSINRSFSASFV